MRYVLFLIIGLSGRNALAQVYGFTTFSSEFKPSGTEQIVKNMPPVRSQDSLGVCYAFSSAALIEHSICKEKGLDCSNVPEDARPSTLDLVRYATDASKLDDGTDPNSYPKKIGAKNTFGMDVMQSVFLTKSMTKESCVPFDSLVAKATSPKQQASHEAIMWKQFKDSYDAYQAKYKDCEKCALEDVTVTAKANDLVVKYGLKTSNTEVLKAFASKSYEEFLFKAIVPEKCGRASNRINFYAQNKSLNIWPKEDEKSKSSYDIAIQKVKDVLAKDEPVMIDKFCTLQNPTPECAKHTSNGIEAGGHSFVVTGYRKMCNSAGKCYDALKVHNSWGQSWQDANNDGWVDAKTLLDRTQYQYASLVWLEQK